MQLEFAWLAKFGSNNPSDVRVGIAALAVLLEGNKILRKSLSYHGCVKLTYQELMQACQSSTLKRYHVEMR